MLALNIFHHFIRTRETHGQLAALLSRVKADVIFFQPHRAEEFEGRGYYRNYTVAEFVGFVREHSGLLRATQIGTAPDRRPIYKLEG